MKQSKFKILVLAAIGIISAPFTAAAAIYGEKYLCLYDVEPGDIKALNAAMKLAMDKITENVKKVQDTADKALEEARQEGSLHAKTADSLKELGETGLKLSNEFNEIKTRMTDLEQKSVKNPAKGEVEAKSAGAIVAESEQWKVASGLAAGDKPEMRSVKVGSFFKAPVLNATGQNQPLVQADRLQGIVAPVNRRLTVRDLLLVNRTSSNLIEFAKELLFTNAAASQGGATSPVGNGEGDTKAESSLTFEMDTTPVITLAHWIPASRQVLSDAPQLQSYIDGRLRYGLALVEEDQLLNGTGAANTLEGLVANATAFNGGTTNQTAIDTLLKAITQISLQNMEASGFVLHPTDWQNILLLKDLEGRYLFADPHNMNAASIWGKPVVATASQTQGQFLAGAFNMAAEIFDREDASVRIAEQHANFFVQNMVAILAEERLALAVYRSAAIVKGSISYAG